METIKISVDVNVNFSESAMTFIKSLFVPASCGNNVFIMPETTDAPAPETTAAPKTTAAPETTAAPKTTAAPERSIEDVRKALAEKVNEHRETIKQKLNELGAPSVTKLGPAKYDEMYNFLVAL